MSENGFFKQRLQSGHMDEMACYGDVCGISEWMSLCMDGLVNTSVTSLSNACLSEWQNEREGENEPTNERTNVITKEKSIYRQ